MEKLIINATESSPQVILDPTNQHYEISGRSYVENPLQFFENILQFIDRVFAEIEHPIRFKIVADYYNSISSRYLMTILKLLKSFSEKGKNITILWYYNDEEAKRDGEILEQMVQLTFEYHYYEGN